MMELLKGKSVLVTGASSGIGSASARAFARAGMKVVMSARSKDRLIELARELEPDTIALSADLTDADECDGLVSETIARLGRLLGRLDVRRAWPRSKKMLRFLS